MSKLGRDGPMIGRLLLIKVKVGKDNDRVPVTARDSWDAHLTCLVNTEIWLNFLDFCINKLLKSSAKN